MAFRKTLAHRLYNISKISSPFASPSLPAILPPNPATTTSRQDFLNASDSGEKGFFMRFLQRRALLKSDKPPELSTKLIGDRIRFDGLYAPALEMKPEPPEAISIEDAKKLLRVSHLEMLKSTLRQIPKSCIPYSEFLEICAGDSSPDRGLGLAKMLDDSGSVIVLGNVVYLRPEQVTKAMERVIPLSIPKENDPRRKELEIMEIEKGEIDREAEILVRRELWAGLGFLVVQTAGFMRLTFWELSWDVMEPICFYLTSIYFMAGYSFFLRTSKDPSFEGLFESRFNSKQKRLLKKKKFDMQRFDELRRACYPFRAAPPSPNFGTFDSSSHRSTLIGAIHH